MNEKLQSLTFLVGFCLLLSFLSFAQARPTEEERVRLWYEANNTWPPRLASMASILKVEYYSSASIGGRSKEKHGKKQ